MKRPIIFLALAVAIALPVLARTVPFSFWKTASAPGGGDANPITRTYVSDGDTNGVFYYVGQNYSSGAGWTNPNTAGRLSIVASSLNTGGDTVDKLVNRTSDHCDTNNSAGSYYTFDVGAGRTLVCNKMSFRWRPDDSTAYTPTGWLLQGSTDNSTYTTILTVSGATPGLGTWRSDTVSTGTAYRYFRVKQNGTNVNGTSFFAVNEIELYGTFAY